MIVIQFIEYSMIRDYLKQNSSGDFSERQKESDETCFTDPSRSNEFEITFLRAIKKEYNRRKI